MDIIDRSKPIPLYYQIKEHLKGQILDGALSPGDKLPTEQWISDTYRASRVTVRHAIEELVQEGLVDKRRGRGAFVTKPKFDRRPNRLTSLHEDLDSAGISCYSRLLWVKNLPADQELAHGLRLDPGEPLWNIRRIRYADNLPFCEQIMNVAARLLPDWDPRELEHRSFYQVLESRYGLTISYADQSIDAVMPSNSQMEIFELTKREPLLHTRRITFLEGDVPVELTDVYHVASTYKYSMTLYR